jgi:hypothetical protein
MMINLLKQVGDKYIKKGMVRIHYQKQARPTPALPFHWHSTHLQSRHPALLTVD